ncbi:MAG: 30S ribosome-binding factor RbfA [Pyrinomonadaceae bacterium]|nr:30S ribosome-binding factor RbfA [Pyrinomonadaceae bacterium]
MSALPPSSFRLPPLVTLRRPEKVAEAVREEIIQIVGYELDDPRVLGVMVTDVRMADDLRDASVYVMVEGSEEEIGQALVALRNAAPYVRRQLSAALSLRHAPLIHFVRDTVEERAARVDKLLNELGEENRRESAEETKEASEEGDAPPAL